ncbi:hypothetical protein [Pseudoxanthomonas sp.]
MGGAGTHGLVLSGMPVASTAMGVDAEAYTVLAVGHDGTTSAHAQHGP